MTISNEAVEAAAKASWEQANSDPWNNSDTDDLRWDDRRAYLDDARVMLEAAAPFIRAQALEDAADHIMGPSDYLADRATCHNIANELRARAVAERGGADACD